MRSDDRIRIYPEYFDKTLTRAKGRRVPQKLALENPTLNELKISGQKLGFQVETEPEGAYPRVWYAPKGILYLSNESGVKIELSKNQILINLSKTVTDYARPKIQEYIKQKEQQLAASKKQGKKSEQRFERKQDRKQKPFRRRR